MDENEIRNFLTYLAVKENVALSTQNQTLQSILFLYKNWIEKDIGWIHEHFLNVVLVLLFCWLSSTTTGSLDEVRYHSNPEQPFVMFMALDV